MGFFTELIARIGADTSGFEQGISRCEMMAQRFGGNVGKYITGAFGAASITGGLKMAIDKADELAERMKEITTSAARLGMTADSYQSLAAGLDKLNLGAEKASAAFRKLNESIFKSGDKDVAAAWKSLGVNPAGMNSGSAFAAIASRLEGQAMTPDKMRALSVLMGEGAGNLAPGLSSGAFTKQSPFAMDEKRIAALQEYSKTSKGYGSVWRSLKDRFWSSSIEDETPLYRLYRWGGNKLGNAFGTESAGDGNRQALLEKQANESYRRLMDEQEIAKIEADLRRDVEKFHFDSLSDDEKRLALTEKRASIQKEMAGTEDKATKLKLGRQLLETDQSFARLAKTDKTTPTEWAYKSPSGDKLREIGGFTGAAQNAQLAYLEKISDASERSASANEATASIMKDEGAPIL